MNEDFFHVIFIKNYKIPCDVVSTILVYRWVNCGRYFYVQMCVTTSYRY